VPASCTSSDIAGVAGIVVEAKVGSRKDLVVSLETHVIASGSLLRMGRRSLAVQFSC
jgi:hypothetical protein